MGLLKVISIQTKLHFNNIKYIQGYIKYARI